MVARNYLIQERPDAILNIIDGTNLERNLYLTTQLLELGIPMVVAVNMMDIVNKRAISLTRKSCPLSWMLVIEISALKGHRCKTGDGRSGECGKQQNTPFRCTPLREA